MQFTIRLEQQCIMYLVKRYETSMSGIRSLWMSKPNVLNWRSGENSPESLPHHPTYWHLSIMLPEFDELD